MGRLREWWRRRPDACLLLGYALLVGAFYAPLLGGAWTLYFDDTNHWYYPIRALSAEAWRSGCLPLWTPLIQAGYPLLAEGQAGALYPPQALFLVLPPTLALSWTVALHAWAAAALTHGFLRCLGVRPASAALGAVAFACSGAYVGHLVYLPMAFGLVWLPGACWGVEASCRGRHGRGFGAAGVCLALALTAVHAQMAAYVVGSALAYGLLRVVGTPGWRLPGLLGLVGMVGLGGLLAAAQLAPLAELLSQTDRGAALDRGLLTQYGLTLQWVLFLFFPRFFGHPTVGPQWADLTVTWELNASFGIVPAVLALIAPVVSRRRVVWALAALWWGTFLLAWGRATPLFELLHSLPVMQSFRIPARYLVPGTCFGAALAALALDAVRREPELAARRLKAALPLSLAALAGVVMLAWLALDAGRAAGKVGAPEVRSAVGALVAGVALWYAATMLPVAGRGRRWLAPVLVALTLAELWGTQRDVNPVARPAVLDGTRAVALDPAAARLRQELVDGERIFVPPYAPYALLKPSSHALAGLASIESFAPLRLARVDTLLNLWKDDFEERRPTRRVDQWLQEARRTVVEASEPLARRRLAWLQRLRVRAILPRYGPPGAVGDQDGLWRVPDPLAPAAFVPREVRRVPAGERRARLEADLPPAGEVVYVAADVVAPAEARPGPVAVTSLSPCRVACAVAGPGLLVLNQTAYPGWQAYAAGERRAVVVADTLQPAAVLPAAARVVFVYVPTSFRLGLFLTLAMLAALVAWEVARR